MQPTDSVKISEICYDPSEVPETMFEFVELFNAGASTVFLDGAVISDQGNSGGNETTFQFPGTPLTGTSIALPPGAFLILVGSATGSTYSGIDFEFYGGPSDSDDPAVPNLVKTSGLGNDLGLANTGDGLTLSTGISSGNIIPCAEIVDGASWEDGGGIDEVTATSRLQCSDPAVHPGYGDGARSMQRRQNGNDTDRSADDFGIAVRTPGAGAPCVLGPVPCAGELVYDPCIPISNQPVTVTLRIFTAPAGWTAFIHHRVEGAANWDSIAATPHPDSTLTATLPSRANGTRVQYWAQVRDPAGNYLSLPAGGASAPAQYQVGVVTIASIQSNVVADSCASSAIVGKAANIRAVVSHARDEFDPNYFHVQRGNGPNSGIRIFVPNGDFTPNRGDSVEIAGIVDEANCQTRIVMGCGRVLTTNRTVLVRVLTSPAHVALEENESMLVRIAGPVLTLTTADVSDGDFVWQVGNGNGTAWIGGDTFEPDQVGYSYVPVVNHVLDGVTGIVAARQPTAGDPVTRLRLEPRRDPDIDRDYTDVGDTPLAVIGRPRIGSNVPNPFNPSTRIEYEVATSGAMTLRIFDATGRAVRTLVAGANVTAGTHRALWDGRDDAGNPVSSGLYVVRLDSNDDLATRKIVLLR